MTFECNKPPLKMEIFPNRILIQSIFSGFIRFTFLWILKLVDDCVRVNIYVEISQSAQMKLCFELVDFPYKIYFSE